MQNLSGFEDYFSDLEDPRSPRNRKYSFSEILFVILSAMLCGADSWEDIELFGKSKISFLREYFPYKSGTPSDDTIRRFLRALDPNSFKECFTKWIKSFANSTTSNHIAIDGKTSRHSFDHDKNSLHMVSAFCSENKIVLGQEKVSDHSNEITAIPKLLDILDINGTTVTIDAMGCQHNIAQKILSKQGDYIFSLKGNQSNLHEMIKEYMEDKSLFDQIENCSNDTDKGHGRIEERSCKVLHDIEWIKREKPEWSSIESVIVIDSTRDIIRKNITKERRYYISSKKLDAEEALTLIRSHWAIENSLHWVLDMSFGDDQSRIRKGNAPQIIAILRHITYNLLQQVKKTRQSIKGLRKALGWDHSLLNQIIQQNFS